MAVFAENLEYTTPVYYQFLSSALSSGAHYNLSGRNWNRSAFFAKVVSSALDGMTSCVTQKFSGEVG